MAHGAVNLMSVAAYVIGVASGELEDRMRNASAAARRNSVNGVIARIRAPFSIDCLIGFVWAGAEDEKAKWAEIVTYDVTFVGGYVALHN